MLTGLRRWWKLALPLGLLLGCGAAATIFFLFKPSYEAVACLKIEALPQHIAYDTRLETGIPARALCKRKSI